MSGCFWVETKAKLAAPQGGAPSSLLKGRRDHRVRQPHAGAMLVAAKRLSMDCE